MKNAIVHRPRSVNGVVARMPPAMIGAANFYRGQATATYGKRTRALRPQLEGGRSHDSTSSGTAMERAMKSLGDYRTLQMDQ